MKKIKKIGILSLARVLGILYALIGLISGVIMIFVSLIGKGFGGVLGILASVGAVIILPIIYGALGFLTGLILGFIYNLISSKIGGIEIEFDVESKNLMNFSHPITQSNPF